MQIWRYLRTTVHIQQGVPCAISPQIIYRLRAIGKFVGLLFDLRRRILIFPQMYWTINIFSHLIFEIFTERSNIWSNFEILHVDSAYLPLEIDDVIN